MSSATPPGGRRSYWPRPRFSILALLVWTAAIATGIALSGLFLRRASNEGWSSLAFWATASLLTLSCIVAANRQGSSRSYWTGFAICGWAYFLLVVCGFAYVPQNRARIREENLITTRISNRIYFAFYTQRINIPAIPAGLGGMPGGSAGGGFGGEGGDGGGFGAGGFGGSGPPTVWNTRPTPGRPFVAIDDFANVAHLLWTLAIAFCGGWISVLIYASGREGRRTADGADKRG